MHKAEGDFSEAVGFKETNPTNGNKVEQFWVRHKTLMGLIFVFLH